MANPKWGTKRSCQSCGTKFYDLVKSPIVCPSCGATFDPEALLKSRRPRAARKPEAAAKTAKAAIKPVPKADGEDQTDDDETEVKIEDSEADAILKEAGDDEDDDLIEDTSDLGDDDDVSEVVVEKEKDDT